MRIIPWTDPDLKTVLVLRLVLLLHYYDVSYCVGRMKDDSLVDVLLPFTQLPRYNLRHEIVKYAKRDKVFADGLDIFSAIFI